MRALPKTTWRVAVACWLVLGCSLNPRGEDPSASDLNNGTVPAFPSSAAGPAGTASEGSPMGPSPGATASPEGMQPAQTMAPTGNTPPPATDPDPATPSPNQPDPSLPEPTDPAPTPVNPEPEVPMPGAGGASGAGGGSSDAPDSGAQSVLGAGEAGAEQAEPYALEAGVGDGAAVDASAPQQ